MNKLCAPSPRKPSRKKATSPTSQTSASAVSSYSPACHSERSEEPWLDLSKGAVIVNNANPSLLAIAHILPRSLSTLGMTRGEGPPRESAVTA